MSVQDPDAGPLRVGDACTKVDSVSVPKQTVYWTCGIAVKGDYACGGGTPVQSFSACFIHSKCMQACLHQALFCSCT